MNEKDRIELEELLGYLCNGTIDDQHEADLRKLLLATKEARQFYVDYMNVHAGMVDYAKQGAIDSLVESVSWTEIESLDDPDLIQTDKPAGRSLLFPGFGNPTTLSLPMGVAVYGLAACLFGFLGSLGASWYASTNAPKAAAPVVKLENAQQEMPNSKEAAPLYVAQLVKFSDDVVWREKARLSEFLLRLRRGDRIELESGMVEVEYYSGATLTLKGPCSFVATGESSGRLEQGDVTGRVSEGDFFLTTPNAKVIDLGTEFGVSIDAENHTNVYVFDGKVEVVSDLVSEADQKSLLLTEGMTAEVDDEGSIRQTSDFDIQDDATFVRKIERDLVQRSGEVSLVDLVSAKSSSQFRLSGVIAPDTGEADQNPWLRDDGPGHRIANGYQETRWHPFVDGVFIPAKVGEYSQLTSTGHMVDLPRTSGRSWGPIWSRRKINQSEVSASVEDYWGTQTLEGVVSRLRQCQTGLIGMHANVGLTIDLNALRNSGLYARKLRVSVENMDNSLVKNPGQAEQWKCDADFQIFVDGKLQASRMNFRRVDGPMTLEVDLNPDARFLTLVSTDSGRPEGGLLKSSEGFDHVVLVDPVLELQD